MSARSSRITPRIAYTRLLGLSSSMEVPCVVPDLKAWKADVAPLFRLHQNRGVSHYVGETKQGICLYRHTWKRDYGLVVWL
jgi:hypothetical protein